MSVQSGLAGVWQLRAATSSPADVVFLRQMLYEAATWRPGEVRPPEDALLSDPRVAVYVEGWGRARDAGIVATSGDGRLGAAWYRTFDAGSHGYGFVEAGIPELTIAVRRELRGRGIGTSLLQGLVERARLDGLVALSLSVERDNPAVHLYERFGFVAVGGVGNTWKMRLDVA